MSPRLKLHPGMTNTNKGFLSFNTTFHHSSIIAENLRYFCFSLSHSNTSETLLCTIPPTNLFAFHSAFPSRINLFQTEQSVFTELNTQKCRQTSIMAAFPEFLITRYECACHQSQFCKRFIRTSWRSLILTDVHMQMQSFAVLISASSYAFTYAKADPNL